MMTDDILRTADAVDAIADLATRAVGGEPLGDRPTVFTLPANTKPFVVDPERFLSAPHRRRGQVVAHEPDALVAYVNRHATDETVLYADQRAATVVAVLNDHRPDAAGWGDHRIALKLRHTVEWDAWTSLDGEQVGQTRLAEHIEDHAEDIIEPAGADMLELAQTFHASTQVRFASQKRLSDGTVKLTYHEDIDASAGRDGQLSIPPEFTVAIAPFEGVFKYRVRCLFRYRLRDGVLKVGYKLHRPDLVLRDAFDGVLAVITENLVSEDIPVLHATPATVTKSAQVIDVASG